MSVDRCDFTRLQALAQVLPQIGTPSCKNVVAVNLLTLNLSQKTGKYFFREIKMSVNAITIVAIMVVAITSFGFLADMILANWRALGKRKGAFMFRSPNKKPLHPRSNPSLDCFRTCMQKFVWDVDETPYCASECKS